MSPATGDKDTSTRSDGRSERARQQRSSRRAQVLNVARAAFCERGYHATSVNQIITRAGIARGTFYLYFENKRAVFEELLDGYLGRIWGAVSRVQLGPDAPSPAEQLRQNVDRVLHVLAANRELNQILLSHAVGLDADFDAKLAEFYGRLLELIDGALSLGQQMGVVRDGDTRILSACVLGTIKEVTGQYLTTSASDGFDHATLVREILDYNLHGLLHASRPD